MVVPSGSATGGGWGVPGLASVGGEPGATPSLRSWVCGWSGTGMLGVKLARITSYAANFRCVTCTQPFRAGHYCHGSQALTADEPVRFFRFYGSWIRSSLGFVLSLQL